MVVVRTVFLHARSASGNPGVENKVFLENRGLDKEKEGSTPPLRCASHRSLINQNRHWCNSHRYQNDHELLHHQGGE